MKEVIPENQKLQRRIKNAGTNKQFISYLLDFE